MTKIIKEAVPDHLVDEEDNRVVLVTGDGEEIGFKQIAGVNYNGGFYAIMQPEILPPGMSEDQAMVFAVTRGTLNGQDSFHPELDLPTVQAVFAIYEKLYGDLSGE